MPAVTTPDTPAANMPSRPRRRRRLLRWVLASAAALIILLAGGTVLAIKLQPIPAPLAIPASVAAPVGPLDGTWTVTQGSIAGFRIEQTVLGMTSEVVGRTEDVTGTVIIAGSQATAADLRINLLALTSNGDEPAPQFAASLDTEHFPQARVHLTRPVLFGDAFAAGDPATATAAGELTLRGVTGSATSTISARRDGVQLKIAGSIPVAFADWGIPSPKGYGALGSLADHGVAEFLLVLQLT